MEYREFYGQKHFYWSNKNFAYDGLIGCELSPLKSYNGIYVPREQFSINTHVIYTQYQLVLGVKLITDKHTSDFSYGCLVPFDQLHVI